MPRWRRLERAELKLLLVGLALCAVLFLFIRLASEVMEGDTQAIDVRILRALRSAADPAQPIGPAWRKTSWSVGIPARSRFTGRVAGPTRTRCRGAAWNG